MPQARLPDINTAFIVYRREAISSWKSQTYDSCYGSLQTLNGLLPKDYRVMISDSDYYREVNKDMLFVCDSCKAETPQNKLVIKEVILSMITNLISGNFKEKVWHCPKCYREHKISNTNMIQQVLEEPHFLGVVPMPPVKKEGMMDRTRFHRTFSIWFWQCLSELECMMAKFRDDNWHKSGEMEDFEQNLEDAGEGED